ncbi:hypothetical protein DY000_02014030 [Brassica cretica]|uniref:Hexosyltransferase n=1 Tax=Brassica cretica TaxID=69181 RepID=A0ABQ7D6F9_BRACR|nr:hypothetical protein DY000_02014030 [Brassica cretica]
MSDHFHRTIFYSILLIRCVFLFLSQLHLSELKAGRCRETVFTGFDRLREARNVKQGSDEELIGIDLVVVDEKVSFPPENLLVFSMGKVWWRALLPMQVSEAAAQIWTKSNPENIVFKLGVY